MKLVREVLKWSPGLVLFVISIYSGSKALSKIPIPIFLALHNLTDFSHVITDTIIHRRTVTLGRYVSLMYIAASSIMISWTDPQFHEAGYLWMMVHILSTGALAMYSKMTKHFHLIQLGDTGRLYYNYLYSFIILAPSSYFIGDALAAREFPFFYLYKFYVGCVSSGVFGVILSLIVIKYKEEYHTSFRATAAVAKVAASLVSLSLFDFIITASNSFWVCSNQLASVAISLLEQLDPIPREMEESDLKTKQNGVSEATGSAIV
ncbi:transmembrane protein 241 [Lingula anatina]|uniref:Transmembrane protein 241 n=1 Tax=Lingula anatina TaxID=7574 RepID=A0A1S3J7G7_LINAN|nr:transmembrane protein 241 [Lingula anatina]|eukprot:XP_013405784.1 transmembrane protein 241 [Lingula anatina]